jgi:hypothetical protein
MHKHVKVVSPRLDLTCTRRWRRCNTSAAVRGPTRVGRPASHTWKYLALPPTTRRAPSPILPAVTKHALLGASRPPPVHHLYGAPNTAPRTGSGAPVRGSRRSSARQRGDSDRHHLRGSRALVRARVWASVASRRGTQNGHWAAKASEAGGFTYANGHQAYLRTSKIMAAGQQVADSKCSNRRLLLFRTPVVHLHSTPPTTDVKQTPRLHLGRGIPLLPWQQIHMQVLCTPRTPAERQRQVSKAYSAKPPPDSSPSGAVPHLML